MSRARDNGFRWMTFDMPHTTEVNIYFLHWKLIILMAMYLYIVSFLYLQATRLKKKYFSCSSWVWAIPDEDETIGQQVSSVRSGVSTAAVQGKLLTLDIYYN